jgi:hypothetical protein
MEPAAHAGRGSRAAIDGAMKISASMPRDIPETRRKLRRSKSLFIAPPIGVRVQNYATSTLIPAIRRRNRTFIERLNRQCHYENCRGAALPPLTNGMMRASPHEFTHPDRR